MTILMDTDIVNTLTLGTTNKTLVHKLGQKTLRMAKELFDLATGHASGEDTMRAINNRHKWKAGQDKGSDEGVDDHINTKREKRLTTASRRVGGYGKPDEKKASNRGNPNHFGKTP